MTLKMSVCVPYVVVLQLLYVNCILATVEFSERSKCGAVAWLSSVGCCM